MFSYYLSLEKSREKIMCSKKTKWEKFASCEIFWIEQILARKEEEIDDTPCTYNFQSAIEKLNECKKINQVLSKTLPFNSAPFKKVYKSSVQSLLLLIKHQKKKNLWSACFWKLENYDQNFNSFKTCQNSIAKKTQLNKAQFEKDKFEFIVMCVNYPLFEENYNIEFSTKASVEKKLCSL